MPRQFGNPKQPCAGIERSRALINTISRDVRERVEQGEANAAAAETGLRDLRTEVAQTLGQACGELCGSQKRCMLESFGPGDPLLRKPVTELSDDDRKELDAKLMYDELKVLGEMSTGVFLG